MSDLMKAAEHWERIACEAKELAAWNRARGFDASAPGHSPGDYQAETALRCARVLRMEHETGLPHCMCHEKPKRDCRSL